MVSRKERLLHQLGITQYRLRNPLVLQGEVAVCLHPETRLVIVSAAIPLQAEQFIDDVVLSLAITRKQVMFLSPEQLRMLPPPLSVMLWLQGVDIEHDYAAIQLSTPALSELLTNPQAKHEFWQQLCTYDSDLFSSSQ